MGNLAVIGIVSQQTIAPTELPQEEQDAAYLLHKEALNYIKRWNQAEEELSSLLKLALIRPIPTVLTLGGVIEVDYLLDQPHEFTFKGIFMDADLRSVELVPNSSFSLQPSALPQSLYMQLSSLQGSILESRTIEDDFEIECISTAKLFGLINSQPQNPQPVTLDTTNIATVLPTLALPQNVKEDIANQVNQGFTVRVPQNEFSYEDWTGTGYMVERLKTGEAGYMLSGMIAGGMTAWNGEKWPEDCWENVSHPFTLFSNKDPFAAYSIYKIQASDRQNGTVGRELKKPLEVMVSDKDNVPVKKARVIFTIKSGNGQFIGKGELSADKKSIIVESDSSGIAEAKLVLGQKTSANACFFDPPKGGIFQEQVGQNLVDARLEQGTRVNLRSPFTAYGFADVPFKIEKLRGDNSNGSIFAYGGFLSVTVTDQYDNPISNQKVTFIAEPTDLNSCAQDNETRRTILFVDPGNPCLLGTPTYQSCGAKTETLEVPTSLAGCLAPFFFGTIPDATYIARAKCAGLADAVFNLRTYLFGNCGGDSPPALGFRLGFIFPTDARGNNINAVKAGTSLPVKARMSFLKEGIDYKDVRMACGGSQPKLCIDAIVGNKKYTEFLDYENGNVKFEGQSGHALGNGIYEGTYLAKPGVNDLHVEGTATTTRNWTDCSYDECSNEINEPTTRTQLWNLIGWLYGVNILTDQKVAAPVDKDGLSISDVSIQYTIEPAEYKAASAYVIIYKGEEPMVYVPGNLQGRDQVTLSRGFQFYTDNAYTAQVVLNNGSGSEIRSEKIKIEFVNLYIEERDPEFPNSKLKPFDYYPNLGTKRIIVKGVGENGDPFTQGSVRARVIVPNSGTSVTITPQEEVPFTDQGEAVFNLSAPTITPADYEKVEIEFTYVKDSADQGSIRSEWRIRNNSNVKMKEVLAGEAVFVFDDNPGNSHKGVTPANVTDDQERYFDFVQELLNQVVPRKRTLDDVIGSIAGGVYSLVTENGQYGASTRDALNAFKTNFGMAGRPFGNTAAAFTNNNDRVNYESADDTSPVFRKLTKDYNHRTNPAAAEPYLHQIIDQGTLVGTRESDQDVYINGLPVNMVNDTGLLELYRNVVKKFVEYQIALEDSYRLKSDPQNDISGWISRIYSGVTYSVIGTPQPVSYCYGGRQTVEAFNTTVSKHGAPRFNDVDNASNTSSYKMYQDYRGNIQDADNTVTNPIRLLHGSVMTGATKKWPGLFQKDENNNKEWEWGNNGTKPWCYHEDWAGIDCEGLALQSLRYAEDPERFAADQLLINLKNTAIPGINISEVCSGVSCPAASSISKINTDKALGNVNVGRFFNTSMTDFIYLWPRTEDSQKLIHKGDFVHYSSPTISHISTVYSDRVKIVDNQCRYKIIHANGGVSYTYPSYDPQNPNPVFSRKVMITWQLGTNPLRFGRIKIWN